MVSVETGLSVEEERNVLLKQHVAFQNAPCMVTVLDKEGCIVSQNAESVACLGCHSQEHGAVAGNWGPVSILKELCYDQEDLMSDMQRTLDRQEPYIDRMEIRSPLLRTWLGVPDGERVWHRVHVTRLTDPFSRDEKYCLWQVDVTDVITAELQVLQLQQQYSALLSSILPKQVIKHLLGRKGAMVAGKSSTAYEAMHSSLLAPILETTEHPNDRGPLNMLLIPDEAKPQALGSVPEFAQTYTETGSTGRASGVTQPLQPPLFPHLAPQQQQQQHRQVPQQQESTPSVRIGSPQVGSDQHISVRRDTLCPSGSMYSRRRGSQDLLRRRSSLSGQVDVSARPGSCLCLDQPSSKGSDAKDAADQERSKTPGNWLGLTGQDVLELATFHDEVTILFADIKGFTSLVNQLHPCQVMLFLNSLYSTWDSLLESHEVYKVETIGDCYMAAAGLFCYDEATGSKRLGGHDPKHAHRLLEFAKAMLQSSKSIKTPLGDPVQVRIGIHSGPCSSGVVGQRMPRFCLFGDSVNVAARMESNGVPGCVHASEAAVKRLPGEDWRPTGGVIAKGKGLMQTSLLPVIPSSAFATSARQTSDTTKLTSHDGSTSLSAPQCDAGDALLPSMVSFVSDPSLCGFLEPSRLTP